MTPSEALKGLRIQIESQGPDTPNRHYGRKQFDWLISCIDTLEEALSEVIEAPGDAEDVDPGDYTISELLGIVAQMEIEEMDDTDEMVAAWLTADDIANRLRNVLKENKYWWDGVVN
jgi:hypothetical protein